MFNNEIKLIGPTLNFYRGNPHINSECFMVDKLGLELLVKNNIFSLDYYKTKNDVVNNCEVKMSQIILDNKYNIKCLLKAYDNIDFRIIRGEKYKNDEKLNANFNYDGDPLFKNSYFNMNVNPYEIIFFKSNRKIDNYMINKITEWYLK